MQFTGALVAEWHIETPIMQPQGKYGSSPLQFLKTDRLRNQSEIARRGTQYDRYVMHSYLSVDGDMN